MNRIDKTFGNRKALIPFITAGDPDIGTTEQLVLRMAEAGADMIELGIPFSDPVAEGPIIQQADVRALSSGTTTDALFELVRRVRMRTDIPLAFMTYANPVFVYGTDAFLSACREIGIDALIVPDMPFEEKDELSPACRSNGVKLISMIAPTSEARIAMIAQQAEGFLYCVSSLGVTGLREKITTDIARMVATAKSVSNIPCAVGFGISTPSQARNIAAVCDGVIVGSAIVKLVAQYGLKSLVPVADFVRQLKDAIGIV